MSGGEAGRLLWEAHLYAKSGIVRNGTMEDLQPMNKGSAMKVYASFR